MLAAALAVDPAVEAAAEAAEPEVVLLLVERSFAQPSSACSWFVHGFTDNMREEHESNVPLFEFSFKGSIFVDSIIPGRPSTTPAVSLKFRRALPPPS